MIQIALAYSTDQAEALRKMGFREQTVMVKLCMEGSTDEERKAFGDRQFFRMADPPYQFVTCSFWGRGPG